MIFLSLLMDLMLMFGGAGAFATTDVDQAVVNTDPHRTHGHLPGPPLDNGHVGDSHLHHGQHGHDVTPSGGDHPHDPH